MTAKKWDVKDPGDAELAQAWDEWRFCVSQVTSSPAWEPKAREWRQMYFGLLERKDRLAAAAREDKP